MNESAGAFPSPGPVDLAPPSLLTVPSLVLLVLVYPFIQQFLRYRRRDLSESQYRSQHGQSDDVTTMTLKEAWQIQKQIIQLEFPLVFEKGQKTSQGCVYL